MPWSRTCLLASVSLVVLASLAPASWAGDPSPVPPEVRSELVEYRDGETVLEGVLTRAVAEGPRPAPGVLVVPSWTGVNAQARQSAERLARMGYVAFVVDVYGKGVRPTTPQECGKEAGKYKADRALARSRMRAAEARLRAESGVDGERISAIGYCFGGMCVLELARSGAAVQAVVSFHGSLDTPTPDEKGPIFARVLVCHGADDPWVSQDDVAGFVREMQTRKARWELIQYGGAVHSFTDEGAGSDPAKGAAYEPRAAARAWEAMSGHLAGAF